MLDFIKESVSVWDILRRNKKPIVIYGMGNGADKILDWCEANDVHISGIFASDEFVRGQEFRGFTVEKYDDLCLRLGKELLVVIAFASERPEVLARFAEMAEEQQVVAPHLPLFHEAELVSFEWIEKYSTELQQVYDLLADEQSRKVFADILNYKLSGKIKYLFNCTTQRLDDLRELVALSENENYLDLGAYNGDTINEFGKLTAWQWERITAVEPDRRNCRKLRSLARELELKGLAVDVYEMGIWDECGKLLFSDDGGRQSTFLGNKKCSVPVTTIDNAAAGKNISFIKMDVEGAEIQALNGGRQTLSSLKPKLFIAAYHYDVDLFRVPLLLHKLVPEYRIYLRKHPYVPAWELNYICI